MAIKTFDNRFEKVGDDIKSALHNANLYISAKSFSIYGYNALKKDLNKIENLKFIFSTPFMQNLPSKNRKIFAINKKSISATEFELDLKNKLDHAHIAKECKKWIDKRATFKSVRTNAAIADIFIVENQNSSSLYLGIDEFSSAGFGYKKDNAVLKPITKIDDPNTIDTFKQNFLQVWNNEEILKDVTQEIVDYIGTLYKENSPQFIYYLILYHIFNEFLEDLNEDTLANEKTGFKDSIIWNKLFDFQKDAVLGIINKLEKFNGCILADSVGLGKTFTALGVIKYYQERNKSILVLCPKKLGENWKTFLGNYADNPLIQDRFNYDVLYHTDLLRTKGYSNGIDLSRINWSNYDLMVIDESHNFRNNDPRKDKKTRYQKLLDDVIKKGVKTKVLMLSATPVNNRFNDLKNQLALAYEGNTHIVDQKLGTTKSIDTILRNAQKIFNDWMKLPQERRTAKELLKRLNTQFDFFKLLDSVTIARSRKHIEKYYDMAQIGKFPQRLKPITKRAPISDLPDCMPIKSIYNELGKLNMSLYAPFDYILPSKRRVYEELYDTKINERNYLKQSDRERSLKTLMRVNLLKRLESSVHSFRLTLKRFIEQIEDIIQKIDNFETKRDIAYEIEEIDDEENFIGEKVKIDLKDLNIYGWREDLQNDLEIAKAIYHQMQRVTPEHDTKLQELKEIILQKLENPINKGNKKLLIFTAFADTADYLYHNIKDYALYLGLQSAKIVGSNKNETTLNIDKNFNTILSHFSPRSKEAKVAEEIDILIATDCISEGQNLQDCDMLINYDIHWNPVRIIQRFGRIDRIGSPNEKIQLVNFWPELSLDDYINLKARVEARMYMVDTTATGEDNILTNESADLIFRKKQLEKLQNEVIDLEDIDTTVSITDLGLNDFRMDLVNYLKEQGDLEDTSTGLHTVIFEDANKGLEEGAIFVLKNIGTQTPIDNTNQLHPFYLVYIKKDGSIAYPYTQAKSILDLVRSFSKNQKLPIKEAYERFNQETNEGKDMQEYSSLLNAAIESILQTKEESAIDSLFHKGGTILDTNEIKGIEDFELIAFIIIKAKDDQAPGK